MKRVLIIAPVHRAWGNRVMREARALVDDNYHVSAILRFDSPSRLSGINIIQSPVYRNRLQRFLSIGSVFLTALKYRADIYHLHNPDMIPVALLLRLCGKCVVYDTHEDYSRRLQIRSWIPPWLKKPLGVMVSMAEGLVAKVVQAVFVTQPNQLEYFGAKAHLVRNLPDIDAIDMAEVKQHISEIDLDPTVLKLVYIGGLSAHRGLSTMLEALLICNRNMDREVRLLLGGPDLDGSLELARVHPAWTYVDYLGVLSHEKVFAYILTADIGLAILSDVGDHASAVPTKLFEYMAMGTPFVASNFVAWRSYLEGCEAGEWVEPDQPSLVADSIARIVGQGVVMGEQGKQFIQSANWGTESRILKKVYRDLLGDT